MVSLAPLSLYIHILKRGYDKLCLSHIEVSYLITSSLFSHYSYFPQWMQYQLEDMATANTNQEKVGVLGKVWERLKALPKVLREKVLDICRLSKQIAQDDPRKVIHSLKVGLAISLVSLFYFYQPLYENFGLSAMWAVMTVVVVFEFTVGKYICAYFH